MVIEQWPTEKPILYARNARKLSPKAVDKVAASIKEFGFRQPVVCDREGVVVVGHTRLAAAKKLELATVPVHVATELTPAQIKAYRLADNRTNEETEWDMELLGLEMLDLKDLASDLDLTGFNPREIDSLLLDATAADANEEAVPDLPENPVTKLGDVWLCGPHRVLCGDATSPETVARLLGARRPFLLVTDPPYGIELDSEGATARG